jgi:transposase
MAEGSVFAQVEIEDAISGAQPRDLVMAPSGPDRRSERIEIAIAGATVLVPAGVDAPTLTNVFVALRSAR